MQEHTSNVKAASDSRKTTKGAAKRMIAKVAKDMNDYAAKIDRKSLFR